jgi:TolA-binding protein
MVGILLSRSPDHRILAALGGVLQAPVYLGIPVRVEPPNAADATFRTAMVAYGAGQFAEAARGLGEALRAGADSAPAEFFLGASWLMTGQAEAAAAAFARTIALGETPYLPEARYYRAKALLRLGRGREALAELEQVGAAAAIIGRDARVLADSIREALRR